MAQTLAVPMVHPGSPAWGFGGSELSSCALCHFERWKMEPLSLDLSALQEAFADIAKEMVAACDGSPLAAGKDADPELLATAVEQLFEVLKRVDSDERSPEAERRQSSLREMPEVSELGDYGLTLIDGLTTCAERMGLESLRSQAEWLAVPFALWLARRGAELRILEPVVNALASIANATAEAPRLEELCNAMGEIIEAVSPVIRQDLPAQERGRPWRLLNLNRGIVATRAHNPLLMERAFRSLTENLPEEAPEFFREGMAQMDALDYPDPVRRVMERYYTQWSVARTLH